MNITRFHEASEYFPPEHIDMRCLRLQGKEAGPSDVIWLGVSEIEPGGHTSLSSSTSEKFYFVLQGQLTVAYDDGSGLKSTQLRAYDSCRLAPGEKRQLLNETHQKVVVLLAMPTGV